DTICISIPRYNPYKNQQHTFWLPQCFFSRRGEKGETTNAAARWNLGKKRGGDGAPLDGSDVRGGGSDSSTPAPWRGCSQRPELNYHADAVSENDQQSQPNQFRLGQIGSASG